MESEPRRLGRRYPCLEQGCERWFKLTHPAQTRCKPCQILRDKRLKRASLEKQLGGSPSISAMTHDSLERVQREPTEGGVAQAIAKIDAAGRLPTPNALGEMAWEPLKW